MKKPSRLKSSNHITFDFLINELARFGILTINEHSFKYQVDIEHLDKAEFSALRYTRIEIHLCDFLEKAAKIFKLGISGTFDIIKLNSES